MVANPAAGFRSWAEVDAALAEWRDTLAVVDENLGELNELEPMQKIEGTAFIAKVPLEGETRRRVGPAIDALREVWAHRDRLGEVVAEAASARKGAWILNEDERLARVNQILNGPSIVLAGTKVPLALRSLVSPGQQQNRLTPHDLLDAMKRAFEEARDAVLEVDQAWSRVLPEITAKVREIERLQRETADVDPRLAADCADLKTVAEGLRGQIERDPLGVDAGLTMEIEPHLADLRRRFEVARDANGLVRQRLDRADVLIQDLRRMNDEIRSTQAQCIREIRADIEVKPPFDDGKIEGLAPWLATLQATATAGRIQAALVGTERWLDAAEAYAAEMRQALDVNTGLIARRDDLRGLLAARKAQADSLAERGLYLPAEAEAAHQQARALLARQPSPLALIAGFVHTYDTAVATLARSARRS